MLVVGIDGTAEGVAALRWAVAEARWRRARVLALAVSGPPPVVGGGAEIAGGAIVPAVLDDEDLTAAAEAWLSDALAALPADARESVEGRVAHGDAVAVLLEAAGDADLLVLGNHGRGALAGALAGSVALRCAHHADCPVVLVPAGPRAASAAGAGSARMAT